MANRLEYIVGFIEQNLVRCPELAKAICCTLRALIKIRKMNNYQHNSVVIIDHFQTMLDGYRYKNVQEKDIDLNELKRVVSEFTDLSDQEAESLQKYFLSVAPKQIGPLANYLSEKLGIPADPRCNPDDFDTLVCKVFEVLMAMNNSDRLEDFKMRIPESVSNEFIRNLILEYYKNRGYQVLYQKDPGFLFRKDKEMFSVCMTRSDILEITVNQD